MLFPDARPLAMLARHLTADAMPDSPVVRMLSWCVEEFGTGSRLAAASRDRVDTAAAIRFLADAEARCEPVCILGTTAAFAVVFSELRERGETHRLAKGSRMMDTGGAKGQTTPLRADEVIQAAGDLLSIPPRMVINEYGMTELCSQLYDATPLNCPGARDDTERLK